jgi:hypothetical protein
MDDKDARPAGDPKPGGEPLAPGRKPWHAPQFMLTDIALSNTGANPPTLDAPTVSQQS